MHPIMEFRMRRGLSRRQLGLVASVPYHSLYEVETGHVLSVHPRLAAWLRENGYPGDPQADHARWREEQRQALAARRGDPSEQPWGCR